tara:strand:+ start:1641 stop:2528 length:888 start_codon:yes stop_codon:yes gene_type:complete
MKNRFFYLLVLVLFTTISNAGSYQLKYRIECAKSNDLDLIKVINKIPELRTFMLPSGSEIYFSGDYFFTFPEADTRLNEIKALGFKDAFIRVFKYQKMLSKPVGNRYITKVIALEKRKEIRREKEERASLEFNSKEKKETKRFKAYSKAEVEALKEKSKLLKKAKEAKLVANRIKASKKEKEDKVEKLDEIKLSETRVVDEAPVFKILLAKTSKAEKTPDLVQLLTDEVVYSYLEGSKKYYAVGFYETSKHANRRKKTYAKYATQEPEVIGLYKGKIVSLKLAQELYREFKKYSK